MMSRAQTYTLFSKYISDITGMFSWEGKWPDTDRSRLFGMKYLKSLWGTSLKSIIYKLDKISIIFLLLWGYILQIFHSDAQCDSASDMRRTRLPSFWNSCLFITVNMDKINRSPPAHRWLPRFLENFPESQDTDTSICHHLVSWEYHSITMHIRHSERSMRPHLWCINDKKSLRTNNISHFFKRMKCAGHIARILKTHDLDGIIQCISEVIQVETIMLI